MAKEVIYGNKALFGVKKGDNTDGFESTPEQVASALDNDMFELASFYDDLYEWGYGLEGWPSDIPLPEEQQRGVERRREFMIEVARECISEFSDIFFTFKLS